MSKRYRGVLYVNSGILIACVGLTMNSFFEPKTVGEILLNRKHIYKSKGEGMYKRA
jgi:hypothetical protein